MKNAVGEHQGQDAPQQSEETGGTCGNGNDLQDLELSEKVRNEETLSTTSLL